VIGFLSNRFRANFGKIKTPRSTVFWGPRLRDTATLKKSPIATLRERLYAGDLSAEFLAVRSIEKIGQMDGRINAINSQMVDFAMNLAKEADRRLMAKETAPLLGVPIVIKDNMAVKGQPLQNGSLATKGLKAPYTATVVDRLMRAGAVPVARAAMDEFAMGSSGERNAFGSTRNPWNVSKVAGGSSSGSAAAVAAGYVNFALGSDTGGSVRLPAAFCGISAFRPTYGGLSRYGVTAMASSMDQVGPMASHVCDLALGMSAMAGIDLHDSTSIDLPGASELTDLEVLSLKGIKVGFFSGESAKPLQPALKNCITGTVAVLEKNGAEVIDIDLPGTSYALETYCLLNTAEASSNLSRFDGLRYGNRGGVGDLAASVASGRSSSFGLEVKRRILLGTFCLSKGHFDAYYLKALRARNAISRSMADIFQNVDFIVAPVSPMVAFALGERMADPLDMYMMDILTVLPALADLPALTVPAGQTDGLPVGVQFIGPRLSDCALLRLGHTFQQLTDFHLAVPPDCSPPANCPSSVASG
jgi:aspartyl-tRNA(Asn)/glutamyl-tRNA(Gln) amidotransferase subunit A